MTFMQRTRRFFRTPFGLLILGLLVAGLAALTYGYIEDFDFYDPSPMTCAAPADSPEVERFIAFGDYGQGSKSQFDLARAIAEQYEKTPFETAFLLGDNFYPDGDVKKYAHSRFEVPYKPLIEGGVKFYTSIGNHDDRKGHIQDLMAYFDMPDKYYKVTLKDIDFFILNTTYFVRSPEQRAWIEKSLAESRAPWKIVIGHHPLYASDKNGGSKGLREVLEPLLQKYGADMYLAGHEHYYQRFEPINGVDYIVSGGGGASLYPFKSDPPHPSVRIRTHHFLLFEALGDELWMKALNERGQIIDCAHWKTGSPTN